MIWHNWNLVHPAKVAAVLETTEEKVVAAAEAAKAAEAPVEEAPKPKAKKTTKKAKQ